MPKSHSHKRNGADAAFARAIARAEFGRFYCDENDLREVRRSDGARDGKSTKRLSPRQPVR